MQAPPLATFDRDQLDTVSGGWDWARTNNSARIGGAFGALGGAYLGLSTGPLSPVAVAGGALAGYGIGALGGAGLDAVSQVAERWARQPSDRGTQCNADH